LTDFFISYTGIDKAWAEWIGWVLEDAGFSVALQDWDFSGSSNFVLDIHRAATEARQTVAVLSPEYLGSAFCSAEWAAALAKDPDGLTHCLLPVRVRECQLNGLWTAITHVDLVGLNEDSAKERLLSRAQGNRGKPSEKPQFPGTALPPTEAGSAKPDQLNNSVRLSEHKPAAPVEPTKTNRGRAHGLYLRMTQSAVFFDQRFAEAFPGRRENLKISDPQRACDHILRLLRAPLSTSDGEFAAHPIWWWRGDGNMPINKIKRIGLSTLLMDVYELEMDFIIAYPFLSYKHRFVYVQTKAMNPTGVYPDTHREATRIGSQEEYGIFKGRFITRAEYDDDGAELDGKFVRFNGKAELRVRTLTPYNWLIAPHASPINNQSYDDQFDSLLDNIIEKKYDPMELGDYVRALPIRNIQKDLC
jgi:hypothetical protein